MANRKQAVEKVYLRLSMDQFEKALKPTCEEDPWLTLTQSADAILSSSALERKMNELTAPYRRYLEFRLNALKSNTFLEGDAYATNKYNPKPASMSEAGLFYSQRSEKDELLGTIGHLRMDFGRNGKEFWTTWFDHCSDRYNTKEFKEEIDDVVNELRLSVLKDRSSMRGFCSAHGGEIASSYGMRQFGYILETDHYKYCLRCKPMEGDYDGYLYCYDKRVQEMWEISYPYLSDTADFDLLIATYKQNDLKLAEDLVSDYYNGKYEVEVPRCEQADENGYHQIDFDQPFTLIAHDDRYLADLHLEELAVTAFKWLEGFEDTGYFMELVGSYADELSEMREESSTQEIRM